MVKSENDSVEMTGGSLAGSVTVIETFSRYSLRGIVKASATIDDHEEGRRTVVRLSGGLVGLSLTVAREVKVSCVGKMGYIACVLAPETSAPGPERSNSILSWFCGGRGPYGPIGLKGSFS